jgi:hypothetical protein
LCTGARLEPHVAAARVMPKKIVVLTDLVLETGDQRGHAMSGRRSVQGLRPIAGIEFEF